MLDALATRGREFPQGMGHACLLETSMILAVAPELARPEEAVPDARAEPAAPWLADSRPWHETTMHGGVGDPTGASAELGRELLEAAAVAVADLADTILAA